MQLDIAPGGQRKFLVNVAGHQNKVVRNKNTGQSFLIRGSNQGNVELAPVQGEDVLVPINSFTRESWEVIH